MPEKISTCLTSDQKKKVKQCERILKSKKITKSSAALHDCCKELLEVVDELDVDLLNWRSQAQELHEAFSYWIRELGESIKAQIESTRTIE